MLSQNGLLLMSQVKEGRFPDVSRDAGTHRDKIQENLGCEEAEEVWTSSAGAGERWLTPPGLHAALWPCEGHWDGVYPHCAHRQSLREGDWYTGSRHC